MALEDLVHPLLGAYTRSPQWVKSTVGWAYARLPEVVRLGGRQGQWRSLARERRPEVLHNEAMQRLRQTLKVALEQVPFYAPFRGLARDLENPLAVLKQLPVVSKTEIKAELEAFVARSATPSRRLETFTGGSTAHPMRFFLERHVTRAREYAFIADFQGRVGMDSKDVVLALRGRTVPTAAAGGRLWMYEPIKRQLILSSDHLTVANMPAYVEAMRRFRPTVIEAYASALYPLAKWLRFHPADDVLARIKGVLLYSESVPEHQLALFKQVFGCPVLRHYGHSERVLMAATLPGDEQRYHFWPQYGHLELVDHDGRSITQPGMVGEIVGTSFDNQVMPFVRYRTGDLGKWSWAPADPSLPGFPVLDRVDGRLQEMVVCRDGRLISVTTLGAAHFDELAQVEAIQYEQREPGVVQLKVQCHAPLPPASRAAIEQAVRDKTQGGCVVQLEEVRQIKRTARNKQVMLIQHLDLSRVFASPQAPIEAPSGLPADQGCGIT